MTTDTRRKEMRQRAGLQRHGRLGAASAYTIAGCAKGAGMIHPNMATMLAFVTTDAAVDAGFPAGCPAPRRRRVVQHGHHRRRHQHQRHPGAAGQRPERRCRLSGLRHAGARVKFQAALDFVCVDLARPVAADGEAATRLIRVTVRGAASLADARRAARSVAGSNLTKCAVHGADPNWGRILCAVGYSGAEVNPTRLELPHRGGVRGEGGTPVAFDDAAAHAALTGSEVTIRVDLHLGNTRPRPGAAT